MLYSYSNTNSMILFYSPSVISCNLLQFLQTSKLLSALPRTRHDGIIIHLTSSNHKLSKFHVCSMDPYTLKYTYQNNKAISNSNLLSKHQNVKVDPNHSRQNCTNNLANFVLCLIICLN